MNNININKSSRNNKEKQVDICVRVPLRAHHFLINYILAGLMNSNHDSNYVIPPVFSRSRNLDIVNIVSTPSSDGSGYMERTLAPYENCVDQSNLADYFVVYTYKAIILMFKQIKYYDEFITVNMVEKTKERNSRGYTQTSVTNSKEFYVKRCDNIITTDEAKRQFFVNLNTFIDYAFNILSKKHGKTINYYKLNDLYRHNEITDIFEIHAATMKSDDPLKSYVYQYALSQENKLYNIHNSRDSKSVKNYMSNMTPDVVDRFNISSVSNADIKGLYSYGQLQNTQDFTNATNSYHNISGNSIQTIIANGLSNTPIIKNTIKYDYSNLISSFKAFTGYILTTKEVSSNVEYFKGLLDRCTTIRNSDPTINIRYEPKTRELITSRGINMYNNQQFPPQYPQQYSQQYPQQYAQPSPQQYVQQYVQPSTQQNKSYSSSNSNNKNILSNLYGTNDNSFSGNSNISTTSYKLSNQGKPFLQTIGQQFNQQSQFGPHVNKTQSPQQVQQPQQPQQFTQPQQAQQFTQPQQVPRAATIQAVKISEFSQQFVEDMQRSINNQSNDYQNSNEYFDEDDFSSY